jgi:hypothetical protein
LLPGFHHGHDGRTQRGGQFRPDLGDLGKVRASLSRILSGTRAGALIFQGLLAGSNPAPRTIVTFRHVATFRTKS